MLQITFKYVEKAWESYRRNWKVMVSGIFLVSAITVALFFIGVAPAMVSYLAGNYTSVSEFIAAELGTVLFSGAVMLAALFVSMTLNGGLVRLSADALKGKPNIKILWQAARNKWKPLVSAGVIIGLSLSVIFFGLALVAYQFDAAGSAASSGAFLVIDIAAVLVFALLVTFVNQEIVIGNKESVQAIMGSMRFVRRHFISVIALFVIFMLLGFSAAWLDAVVPLLGTLISVLVVAPLQILAFTHFYLTNRGRR